MAYTVQVYEKEFDEEAYEQRFESHIDMEKVDAAESPKKEWLTQITDYLKQTPKGEALAAAIERNKNGMRNAWDTLFERTVQKRLEANEPEGPYITQGEAELIKAGSKLPPERITVVANLNEDTIYIRRTPRTWNLVYVTVKGKEIPRYRSKITGKFVAKPPVHRDETGMGYL